MSVLKTPPAYDSRSVKEWLTMAARGDVLLPNFQRSFVWKPQQTAEYLRALLEKRPTGSFLILEAEGRLPFGCRSLHRVGSEPERITDSGSASRELVLDGQQRLTALWGALKGVGPKRYVILVNDLLHNDPEVETVIWKSPAWSNPAKMYRENCVPADILGGEPADISHWCQEAAGDEWLALHDTTSKLRERLVTEPKLQYCLLKKDTGRDTAIDIFINVNRSAVKLKEVDIAIAMAEADHEVDLRSRVADYVERSTEIGHYFSPDLKRAIPEVAEWMLKVSCLRVAQEKGPDGLAPSATHYPSSVKHLCGRGTHGESGNGSGAGGEGAKARLRQMEDDLDAALRFVAERGGATKRTLPAWPPVHVIAALQNDVRAVGPALKDDAERLLSAYLWRSFVTDRYEKLANARLLEDYRALRDHLRALDQWKAAGGAKPKLSAPAFDTPLPSIDKFQRAGWIGGASRLGKAIAAMAMQRQPRDWVTGERLDPARVRELEQARELERRHVFPPDPFERHVSNDIALGLNGVLLPKGCFKPCDPANLSKTIGDGGGELHELELRARVESHLVRWVTLQRQGAAPKFRYDSFVKERASVMAAQAAKLTVY